MAPRTSEVAGMLAARDRAAGSAARAALLRDDEPVSSAGSSASPSATPVPAPSPTVVSVSAPKPASAAPASAKPSPTPAKTAPPGGAEAETGDTLARLRDAKRRRSGSDR
jgi:hypothetical protein